MTKIDELLYYLWKGILIIIGICILPLIGYGIFKFYNQLISEGEHWSMIIIATILLLIVLGCIIMIGYACGKLLEVFNPKNWNGDE